MKDTPEEVEKLYASMLMRRSGVERMMMGFRMFDMSRRLMVAGLQMDGPLDEGELRARIFLRTYGSEFPPQRREQIADRLRRFSVQREPP